MGPTVDHSRYLACGASAGPCTHHGRTISLLHSLRFLRRPLKQAEISGIPPSSQQAYGNIRYGFVYERVPHITLKSIANNAEIDVIWEKWQATLEPLRKRLNTALKK